MTKEQIAEFREMAANEDGLLDLCFAIRPLIDEREALLEALRDLVNWENGVQDAKDWRMFYAAAQAAIAKAETPYEPPPPTVFVSSRQGQK